MIRCNALKLSCALSALGIAGLATAANPDGTYRMAGRRVTNLGDQTFRVDPIRGKLTLAGASVSGVDALGDDNFQFDLTLSEDPLHRGKSVLPVIGGSASDDDQSFDVKRGVMVFKAGREGRVIYRGRVIYDDPGTDLQWDLVTGLRGAKKLPPA